MPSRSRLQEAAKAANLSKFMRSRARAGCAVCDLPAEIRSQLGRPATKRGYTREDQVEWLREAVGAKKVTLEVLATHLSSKHDQEETA